MPAKNTIKVLIGGKIITLSGYESEEYLQNVASYMNHKLAQLSELPGYNRQPVETKNTLLSLNLQMITSRQNIRQKFLKKIPS